MRQLQKNGDVHAPSEIATAFTRKSAIGDKPRDACVQYAMAWLTPPKHTPPSFPIYVQKSTVHS